MADLNFPKDRTELVPPGTGSLQTGDSYTANGTTWVYDATAGAWGSGTGPISETIYLSRVNDDTAEGAITFEKVSTHEGGIISLNAANYFSNRVDTAGLFRKVLNDTTINDGQDWSAFVTQKDGTTTKTAGVVKGFSASNLTNGSEVYGFHSDIISAPNRYNFYANGTAPNFFQGVTEHASGAYVTGGPGAYSASGGTIFYNGNLNLGLDENNRFVLSPGGSTLYNEGVVRGGYGWNNLSIDGVLDSNVGGSVTSSTVRINPTLSANYQTYSGIHFRPNSDALTGTTGTIAAFRADAFTSQAGALNGIGFLSDLSTAGGATNNYNFYAAGDAPNYFKGLTEHRSGVKVMGGNKTTIPFGISSDNNEFVALNAEGNEVLLATSYQCSRNLDQHSGLSGPTWYGFDVRGVPALATTAALNVRFSDSTAPLTDVLGVQIQGDYSGNVTKRIAGFLSGVRADAVTGGGGHALNFLAQGDAPSHFAGPIRIYPYSEDAYNPSGPTNRSLDGVVVDHTSTIIVQASRSANDEAPVIRINRGGTSPNRRLIDFTAGSGSTVGGITTDGAQITIFGQASDYRIKTNIQQLTNATEKIQSLNPVSFEYTDRNPGVSYQGFVAHELAEICPKAVVGEKDASEAIGTYTDVDGNVETEVTEPEAIPFGATWEQTGTRDLLQAVDATKLIPLLTKALQEALDKIETLETRLSDAGIA